MKKIEHRVKHVYQPTNHTCGYASLSMLLSFYDIEKTVDELTSEVPQPKNEKGEATGSVTAQLVAWCAQNGLKAHMYSFDCEVLDLSWKSLNKKNLIKKLKEAREYRVAEVFGRHWSRVYIDAYTNMLESGAKLTIQPYVTSELIYKLLEKCPVYANICSTVARGEGRKRNIGLRKSVLDDKDGTISNHSIVIYGNDEDGKFLVADPWDGLLKVDPEKMVVIITAAQIECDNQIFVVEGKK